MGLLFLDLDHNQAGKDWVLGDLHGTFDELMVSLEKVGFDTDVDRLFCVGDLHDRGPDSMACLKLMGRQWFYTVDCNHNEIICDFFDGRVSAQECLRAGGQWFLEKPHLEQSRIAMALRSLPSCIRIGKNSEARVNIFHAEYLGSDQSLDLSLPFRVEGAVVEARHSLLWGRTLANQIESGQEKEYECASGLSPSFVGHTPVTVPFDYQNHVFMDCGTWNHSNKSKSRGGDPIDFPMFCLTNGEWANCLPDDFTKRYTKDLSDRIANAVKKTLVVEV